MIEIFIFSIDKSKKKYNEIMFWRNFVIATENTNENSYFPEQWDDNLDIEFL